MERELSTNFNVTFMMYGDVLEKDIGVYHQILSHLIEKNKPELNRIVTKEIQKVFEETINSMKDMHQALILGDK